MTHNAHRTASLAAMDAAFRSGAASVLDGTGRGHILPVRRWQGAADPTDIELFVRPCVGRTLDVGCGPGRLVSALTSRGTPALGIDVSREAVRQTRARGGTARQGDVFDVVPDAGTYDRVLLADGNIGIGGDPVRLLRRVRTLLRPGGTTLVETGPAGVGLQRTALRLQVDGETSEPFLWAHIGVDALPRIAAEADFDVAAVHELDGRFVTALDARSSQN